MSEKQIKRKRRAERLLYQIELIHWRNARPPKWRIFKYWKWKKSKPERV